MAPVKQDFSGGIIGTLSSLVQAEVEIIHALGHLHLNKVIPHFMKMVDRELGNGLRLLTPANWLLGEVEEGVGLPWVDSFLDAALGLNVNFKDKQNQPALVTMRRMVGFTISLAMGMETVKWLSTIGFAKRIPSNFLKGMIEIPQELGISWALGMMINSAYEQSVGQELAEWINEQKRPARLEYNVLMRLVRQHKIPLSVYEQWLSKLGYPDDLKKMLDNMDTTQLPVTDIAQGVLNGTLSENQAKAYFQSLGYSSKSQKIPVHGQYADPGSMYVNMPSDVDLLYEMYVLKSETQSGTLYRAAARKAYIDDHISRNQLEEILRKVHVPEQSITLELAALDFEKHVGRTTFTAADIKKRYIGGMIHRPQAIDELMTLGYDTADADNLVKEWNLHAVSRKPTLTAAKIIAYTVSGVILPDHAVQMLIAQGYSEEGARFLVQHPSPKSSEGGIPFTQDNVLFAYQDGTIDGDQARSALERLGLSSEAIADELTIADFNAHPGHTSISEFRHLGEEHIKTGFLNNHIGDAETIGLLERLGFATPDAMIIWSEWYKQKTGHLPAGNAPSGQATSIP